MSMATRRIIGTVYYSGLGARGSGTQQAARHGHTPASGSGGPVVSSARIADDSRPRSDACSSCSPIRTTSPCSRPGWPAGPSPRAAAWRCAPRRRASTASSATRRSAPRERLGAVRQAELMAACAELGDRHACVYSATRTAALAVGARRHHPPPARRGHSGRAAPGRRHVRPERVEPASGSRRHQPVHVGRGGGGRRRPVVSRPRRAARGGAPALDAAGAALGGPAPRRPRARTRRRLRARRVGRSRRARRPP